LFHFILYVFVYCTYIHIYEYIYIYIFKILETPTCPCGTKDQTVDHLLYECELLNKERDRSVSTVLKTDVWPMSKKTLTLRQLMSYIYGAPILDVSRSHTMTQHSR